MHWTIVVLLASAAMLAVLRSSGIRLSRKKLSRMRQAFAFLERESMLVSRSTDEGSGAVVEFASRVLRVSVVCDRGEYSWWIGAVERPDYYFDVRDLLESRDHQVLSGPSIFEVGETAAKVFPQAVAALNSERAREMVRLKQARAANSLADVLRSG